MKDNEPPRYKSPTGDTETEGLINGMIDAFQKVLDRHVPPKQLVYPLSRGFGHDDEPPPLTLADAPLEHLIYDPGPRGVGPFEATPTPSEEGEDAA